MVRTHAAVFTGGHPPTREALGLVTADSLVIAADSGWHHAVGAGIEPDVLVGDLDSIGADGLAHARSTGCDIAAHPSDKDETDAELALSFALSRGARRVSVVSGGGDRPDHVLALLHAMSSDRLDGVDVDGWLGESRMLVCRPGATTDLSTSTGDTVSLVPVGGDATVSAAGLRWPLDGSVLRAHSSRGVSNVAHGPSSVTVHEGRLIVFVTRDAR